MSSQGQQYLRKISLIVANETDALDLSQFRIRFHVKMFDLQTPNYAVARVYNLKDDTARQIQREFTRVVLQAGYENSNFGILFDGSIKQTFQGNTAAEPPMPGGGEFARAIRIGRESPTETYLDITAADADTAYNFAVTNTTLAAGATQKDVVNAVQQSLEQYNVRQGYLPDTLNSNALPRGKVLFGMAREVLQKVANTTQSRWSIQNGQLVFIPNTSYVPGDAVVLNSASGMIGIPEQTEDGIIIRALLNPNFKYGGRVQINNADIQKAALDPSYQAINFVARTTDDGFYRIIVVDHEGDTRGNEWYSTLVCIAVDDSVTMGLAVKGY